MLTEWGILLKKSGEVLLEISSKDNQKIKYAVRLKQKSFRKQETCFLIEGRNMMEEALKHPKLLRQIFVEPKFADEYIELSQQHPEWECYMVDERLMKHISDTENPPGIVAVCQIPSWSGVDFGSKNAFLVFLDHIADPGNLGTIIRSGWALGADGILLSPDSVDPFNPKVVRASMGGIFNIPVLLDFPVDGLKCLKQNGYKIFCTSLQARTEMFSLDFTGPSVLTIGSESQGVRNVIEKICDSSFKIPIKPEVDSLNAAVACAIIMHEAWKQRQGFTLS
ncbi:MAG: RNA methyltransferase [Syntrophomonas sp.]|uniref:TrmH family RNA methyltransferase n=1 Tax=Syntrophomonas sp. TaxID=2053627 RepID=UPI002608F92E|nr:RNA methyltransferase [Syntrophomonas sp.]MDD2511257.1 RNA methyltransferase [Syntrophomonas sp.]MDD3879716.1 RNA methyltransferase [Syntrophomonas sp.]MDD4627303.1 RNA methyltransferase [Syntrophomonas sp.]